MGKPGEVPFHVLTVRSLLVEQHVDYFYDCRPCKIFQLLNLSTCNGCNPVVHAQLLLSVLLE